MSFGQYTAELTSSTKSLSELQKKKTQFGFSPLSVPENCRCAKRIEENRVSDQAWSLLERILKQQRAGLVIKAASVCTETPVENCFRLSDVFNDLNLHSFRSDQLSDQNENFWTVDPALAIQEDDLEFVPRTTVETY